MQNTISFKSKFGWISATEINNKISRIHFLKETRKGKLSKISSKLSEEEIIDRLDELGFIGKSSSSNQAKSNNQQITQKTNEGYELSGKRSIALNWQNYNDLIAGTIEFDEKNYSGKINNFWELIRRWQSKKWLIALHGYNHVCFKLDKKKKQFLPLNDISEFVGLNINEQKEKLVNAIEIFQKNGISPNIFMAPCHSFDMSTLTALRSVRNINHISDGFSFRPYRLYRFNWIPQQL